MPNRTARYGECVSTAPPPAFDARPLTEPVDRAGVRSFRQAMRSSHPAVNIVITIVVVIVAGSILTTVLGVFATIFISVIVTVVTAGDPAGLMTAVMTLLPMLIFFGVFAAFGVLLWRGFRGRGIRGYRLDRFARANGMTYLPGFSAPQLPGMIFGLGSSRQSSDLVRGTVPRFVEFGNHRYTTGSGKNSTTHRWGYVAVRLDAPLPHIVLDAVGNNALFGSNLPASFDADQRLSLEGDFDRHFALYCPAGYEQDALYLFTPDIMARFIDNAAALDVEIVDDWLFLYGRRDFSTLDPAMWAWLFSVVAALLDKLAQWGRWRDDRLSAPVQTQIRDAAPSATPSNPGAAPAAALPFTAPTAGLRPPPGVAAGGRRLKRGVPWPAVIVFGIVALLWLLGQLGVFGAILGSFR